MLNSQAPGLNSSVFKAGFIISGCCTEAGSNHGLPGSLFSAHIGCKACSGRGEAKEQNFLEQSHGPNPLALDLMREVSHCTMSGGWQQWHQRPLRLPQESLKASCKADTSNIAGECGLLSAHVCLKVQKINEKSPILSAILPNLRFSGWKLGCTQHRSTA